MKTFWTLAFVVAISNSPAAWSVRTLTAAGSTFTNSQAVSERGVGGSSSNAALLWLHPSKTPVNLTPSGATGGVVYGTHSSWQVGAVRIGGNNQASVWQSRTSSWTSLHPNGALESVTLSTSGTHHVGYVANGSLANQRAALWVGSSNAVSDLHPSGA